MNLGPTNFPCAKCNRGVGRGSVFCKTCNLWIHRTCEGLSASQLNALSRIPIEDLDFVCCVCREKRPTSPPNSNTPVILLNEQPIFSQQINDSPTSSNGTAFEGS